MKVTIFDCYFLCIDIDIRMRPFNRCEMQKKTPRQIVSGLVVSFVVVQCVLKHNVGWHFMLSVRLESLFANLNPKETIKRLNLTTSRYLRLCDLRHKTIFFVSKI